MVRLFSASIILLFTVNSGIINNAGKALSGDDEPFKGTGKGTITNIGETRKVFVGTATNSLMGDVYFEMDYNITYDTQYNGGFVPGGKGIARSDNGEELFINLISGTWYINFVPDPPECVFDFSFDIAGGSGRFKNATGKIVSTGTQIYIPSTPTIFDYTGTISY